MKWPEDYKKLLYTAMFVSARHRFLLLFRINLTDRPNLFFFRVLTHRNLASHNQLIDSMTTAKSGGIFCFVFFAFSIHTSIFLSRDFLVNWNRGEMKVKCNVLIFFFCAFPRAGGINLWQKGNKCALWMEAIEAIKRDFRSFFVLLNCSFLRDTR